MKSKLYTIEAISNLHAGSGEVNYGLVDNLVQRDTITQLPVINASSLKGAFREFCKFNLKEDEINNLFGSDPKKEERKVGSYRFFDACLLAIPARSNKVPFIMVTSPMVLNDLLRKNELFNLNIPNEIKKMFEELAQIEAVDGNPRVFNEKLEETMIEDMKKEALFHKLQDITHTSLLSGDAPLALISNKDFISLCDNRHLPIIARNYLNNGKSENLFYEQVLPRMSRLYFVVMHTETEYDQKFENTLESQLVQIGANASVGYGYCKILSLNNLK